MNLLSIMRWMRWIFWTDALIGGWGWRHGSPLDLDSVLACAGFVTVGYLCGCLEIFIAEEAGELR